MAKLITATVKTRQDAALIIEDLKEAGISKKRISVLARTEEDLGIISKDTGLPKPKRGDGNHALFHPLIEVTAILEDKPANVAVIGPAAEMLAGAEIGRGSDDFIVGLVGAGIPEKAAKALESRLMEGDFVLFVESGDEEIATIGKVLSARNADSI